MTSNHIDQLAEWWENAEKGAPSKGDAIIRRTERLLSNGYAYEVGTEDYTDAKHLDNVRILARAPKPRPAWHDAPAVTAKGREDWDHVEAFSRNDDYDPPRWIDNQGITYTAEQLSDVTPLIEAKVTDEMIVRAANAWTGNGYQTTRDLSRDLREDITHALTAALGLETT